MAKELSAKEAGSSPKGINETETFKLGSGSVSFSELDAEKMGNHFAFVSEPVNFDCVWIVEAMSHLPDKKLFFRNAELLLRTGGKLVIADWFKAENVTEKQLNDDIKPIEGWSDPAVGVRKNLHVADGMLLPALCTQADYVRFAEEAGLVVFAPPFDISKDVSKTW